MPLTATVIDGAGATTGTRELPEALFGGSVNVPLMHQVVTAQLAGIRAGTASTKKRSEVRGGGQKPWRQKGTGRARHGSSRSPIWVGGGIVFGPRPRDYSVRLPKKMRAAALRSALADKASAGAVWVLEGFDSLKTKTAATVLDQAGISGRVLLVVGDDDDATEGIHQAFRNLARVDFSYGRSLSTYDVLLADALIFTSGAFGSLAADGPSGSEAEAAGR